MGFIGVIICGEECQKKSTGIKQNVKRGETAFHCLQNMEFTTCRSCLDRKNTVVVGSFIMCRRSVKQKHSQQKVILWGGLNIEKWVACVIFRLCVRVGAHLWFVNILLGLCWFVSWNSPNNTYRYIFLRINSLSLYTVLYPQIRFFNYSISLVISMISRKTV